MKNVLYIVHQMGILEYQVQRELVETVGGVSLYSASRYVRIKYIKIHWFVFRETYRSRGR